MKRTATRSHEAWLEARAAHQAGYILHSEEPLILDSRPVSIPRPSTWLSQFEKSKQI